MHWRGRSAQDRRGFAFAVAAGAHGVSTQRDVGTFADHFSAVAAQYAEARPEYPQALLDWIAATATGRDKVWEAGCGSGQATRDLARVFAEVFATEPSPAQLAQAPAIANVRYEVGFAEQCGLPDASVDAVCVAQALHWFERPRFFAECARVLRPGGVLMAWAYRDIETPTEIARAVGAFQTEIAAYWPDERRWVDTAYAGFEWPFDALSAPSFEIVAEWSLARMLRYFSSYSATKRYREHCGVDPVASHQAAIAEAWGDAPTRILRWPLFAHARRKPE
ncbi:MAG: class I SAM-dependent methyltransferase [Lysobacteraceae bacterium]|nr:MAG: class I SAM-dependent methyltransferase [Xanthomonadaceae bacterium]